MKTIALEEGLADERDILYTIQQDLTIPMELKTVECKDLSDEQEESIQKMVNKIQTQTNALKVTIDGLSNSEGCEMCQELEKEYEWDLLYLN